MILLDQTLRQEIQSWSKFRRTLRKEDQLIFDRLFEKARVHVEAGGSVSRPWPFEVMPISILLEQEKEMEELRKTMKA